MIRAVIAALLIAAPAAGGASLGGVVEVPAGDPVAGGLSGLWVSPDGGEAVAVSDAGWFYRFALQRDGGGGLTGAARQQTVQLGDVQPGRRKGNGFDQEALARLSDGRWAIAFEQHHRIEVFSDDLAQATPLPVPREFHGFQGNAGIEALAVDRDGTLYAIPEKSGRWNRDFPVFRHRAGRWDRKLTVPRRGLFLVTGADIGPDGRLYLLERSFRGVLGFETRVRRFGLGEAALSAEETLLQTTAGERDNLEGISVWRDRGGQLRMVLVSDDNFRSMQRSEIVEYVLTD